MTKKATKQSRATKRRKARQRLQAERAALVARAKECRIYRPELRSNEQLAAEIAWKRPQRTIVAGAAVPALSMSMFLNRSDLERARNDSRNA
jgi:DNA-binding transcriptional regulator YdaS (Cro superfamily)